MLKCPLCNQEVKEGSWYCEECGQELKCCASCGKIGGKMRCEFCDGTMIPVRLYKTNLSRTLLPRNRHLNEDSEIQGRKLRSNLKRIHLSNYSLGIKMQAVNGAIIGRREGPYSFILENQPYISSKHVLLEHNQYTNIWTVTDLNSSNGTSLNGINLIPGEPTAIKEGDKIQLANVELIVESE